MNWEVFVVSFVLCMWLLIVATYFFFFIKSLSIGAAWYVWTYSRHFKVMKKKLRLAPWTLLLDLGSGDGKAIRFFARYYAIQKLKGYERNVIAVWWWRLLSYFSSYGKRITLYAKDFHKAEIGKADYIYLFLIPKQMKELQERLPPRMKKGSIIIANTFKFPDKKPFKVIEDWKTKIYLYKV